MSDEQNAALSPEAIIEQMKANDVSHVIWLPDSETNWLFLRMQEEPSLSLVGIAREGQAGPIAAGVYAGGGRPIILIQNTGMMESGDSMRGWLFNHNIPVVCIVGYRGYTRHGVNKDTAAEYTERFLMAFGIKFFMIESNADAERISIAFEEAEKTRRPVVVLVADEFHGFN